MGRWNPDNQIGPGEQIGRRLFDEPKLSGAPDQNPFVGLDLRNFMETRDDAEFSLDRLGRGNIEVQVLSYLKPRAEQLATAKRAKQFNGWAPLTMKELASGKNSFTVFASAIKAKDAEGNELPWSDQQMEENRYHAHIPIPQDGDDKYENAEIFAHRFREKVKRICLPDGRILKSLPTTDIPAFAGPSRLLAAIKWCKKIFQIWKQ